MRTLWSDKQNCSHNVPQNFEHIRLFRNIPCFLERTFLDPTLCGGKPHIPADGLQTHTVKRGALSYCLRRADKPASRSHWAIHILQRAKNGGLDPSWLDFAFLVRPDFPSRGAKPLYNNHFGASERKIGALQKREANHDGSKPPFSALSIMSRCASGRLTLAMSRPWDAKHTKQSNNFVGGAMSGVPMALTSLELGVFQRTLTLIRLQKSWYKREVYAIHMGGAYRTSNQEEGIL